MSMLKKLKGIFIEELEEDAKPSAASVQKSKPKQAKKGSKSSSIKVDTSKSTKAGKPDEKFVDMLLKAIEEQNLDGFDYLEFKQSLQSLSKVESDEAKRYKSAFAMASTMGLTKENLFSSAKHYASVLSKEEKKFSDAFKKQRETQVSERENRGTLLEESIKSKEAQIAQLQKEIDAEKKKLANVEADINKAVAKVELTKERFYGSYHLVLDQIKDDIDKFSQYLA